ncbi:2Fe-2S iron-sulfur cluster-binding protein [Streptomyces sp. NPDC002076]
MTGAAGRVGGAFRWGTDEGGPPEIRGAARTCIRGARSGAVRRAGAEVLSSCEQGTCGTCLTPVLEGQPDHRDSVLADHERAANDCMFVCVSRSRGDRLVLDL